MTALNSSNPLGYVGINPSQNPGVILADREPTVNDIYDPGKTWIDTTTPRKAYISLGGGTWQDNNLDLSTDGTFAAASNSTASSSLAIKTYVDAVASFGAPIASDSAQGIAWTATDLQCTSGTPNNATNAYIVSPDNLSAIFGSPNAAIGGTTPVSGTFKALTTDGTGAITLSGNASSQFTTTAGDITIDSTAASVNIDGGEADAAAVKINASNAAGGIDVDAGTAGITIDTTGAFSIDSAGASNFTVTGATNDLTLQSTGGRLIAIAGENASQAIYLHADAGTSETIQIHSDQGTGSNSIFLLSDVGGITLTSTGSTDTNAIDINAPAGGIDVDAAGKIAISTSQNAADSMVLESTAGGIQVLASGAAAGEDIVVTATGSSVLITSTEADADAITLNASSGGINADTALSMDFASSQAAATAIQFNASNAAGGITMAAGTAGLLFGNQADCTTINLGNIAPTANRTIIVGGGTVVTASVTDTISIGPDGATTNADSVKTVNLNTGGVTTGQVLTNIASGTVTSGTHTVNIQTGNAAAGTVATNISTGTGTKTVSVGNADGLTTTAILGPVNINVSQNNDVAINSGTSTGTITIGNTAAGAVILNSGSTIAIGDASAGAITVDTAAGISIDGATASNFTVTGSSQDLTLSSIGGSVNISASEAQPDAIVLNASNAAGGIDLTTGGGSIDLSSSGAVSMVPGAQTVASPTASATQNTRVGKVTFTGFTTASAADQDFTITNSTIATTSAVFVSVSTVVGGNDADMTLAGVSLSSGSMVVHTTNNGPAALNTNVIVSWWAID